MLLTHFFSTLAVAAVAFVAVHIFFYNRFNYLKGNPKSKILNKPPGPWGLLFLGHLLFFGKRPDITCMKWAKIYGPIFAVKFGQIPAVVLNDGNIIKEAMNLDTFNGRYPFRNLCKPVKLKGIAFSDGPIQTEQKKFVTKRLKNKEFLKSVMEFKTAEEIARFLQMFRNQRKDLFDNKKPVRMMVHRFFEFPIINSLWISLVGQRFGEDDPRLTILTKAVSDVVATSRSLLVQFSWYFPCVANILRCIGRNSVVNSLARVDNFIGEEIEKSSSNSVTLNSINLTHAYFDQVSQTTNRDSSFYNGQEQLFVTADIFMAGIDTTAATLDWLLFYMATEPQVQKKLQAEIENIVGFDVKENGSPRTPTIPDRVNMPYTQGVIKELLRLSSVAPFAIFHRATKDVSFHGYIIPKDTMIIPNLYAAHHDPEIWLEPEKFRPERFIVENKAEINGTKKSAGLILPFSNGKRVCVGESFARDELFLIATHFFQKFTVSTTNNLPLIDPSFGLIMELNHFELHISERI